MSVGMVKQRDRGDMSMNIELQEYITNVYSKGMFTYLLENYVDKEIWLNNITTHFNDCSITNLTDFNYSKCFTILINFSSIEKEIGTEEYNLYLRTEVMYGIRIEISTLGRFAAIWYIKHFIRDNKEEYVQNETPFLPEHERFERLLNLFLVNNRLHRLNEKEMSLRIPEVSLELSQDNTTVYHCLFHDSSP